MKIRLFIGTDPCDIMHEAGIRVARASSDEYATELVRRANAYEGMLAACKRALACLNDICVDNGPTAETLRAAISSAEGGAK